MKSVIYKLYLPFILAGLCACQVFSQVDNTPGNGASMFHFKLLMDAPIFHCDILGRKQDTAVYVAPRGAVFSKVDTKGANVIIRFWVWKKDTALMNHLNYVDDQGKMVDNENNAIRNKYFLMSMDEFNAKAIPRYNRQPSFTLGATMIPLRIRPKDFDFAGEFSFGASFGAKFPLANYQDISLNLIGGLHITHITLDSADTKGAVLSTTDETAPALTPVLGAVFEFSKAQVGLYLGWDFISGAEKNSWIYQGRPWISIGVGTSIFNGGTNNAPPGNLTKNAQ